MSLTSIVIPAYGHCPHLPGLIRALLEGDDPPDEIIVSHSGSHDPSAELSALSRFVQVKHHSERLLGGAARNRGAAIAKGECLAFIDADVVPRPGWLAALQQRMHEAPRRFVVGAIGYATSGGYWGVCNWLSEFSEEAPWRAARRQLGGASCNMIVRAEDFHEAGGFPEDYQPAEDTMLFCRLREMGLEQWFEPKARVDHHNQSGFFAFARHQHKLGFHSALVRQRVDLPGSVATRVWPLALVLWVARFGAIVRRVMAGGTAWRMRGFGLAPGLLVGSWIWNAGFLKCAWAQRPAPADAAAQGTHPG